MPLPRLDPDSPSRRVLVVLTERLFAQTQAMLKERAPTSMSALVRDLLQAWLDGVPPPAVKPKPAPVAKPAPAAASTEGFSDKGKLRIDDAIRIHKERLNRSFEAQVHAEVRRRIGAADDEARKQLRETSQENFFLRQMLNRKAVFSKAEFRQLQMAVHPDNTASIEVRNRLSDMLVKNERRLVGVELKKRSPR
jgi:hypothetical protein